VLESDLFLLNECDLILEKQFKRREKDDENLHLLRISVRDVQKF
jgi:CHAD domain-containing protein